MKIRSIACAAVMALAGAGLWAQSNTNKTTAGVFTSDADKVVNIESWKNLEPKTFFGFLGYRNSALNLGFAKEFDNFYLGTVINGNLGWGFSTEETKNGDDKTYKSSQNANDFNLTALVGLKAGAFRFNYAHDGNAESDKKTVTINGDTETITTTDEYTNAFDLRYGWSVKAGRTPLTPYAGLKLTFDTDSTETVVKIDGKKQDSSTKTDNSTSHIAVVAGTGIDLSIQHGPTHKINVDTVWSGNFRSPYEVDSVKVSGGGFNANIIGKYKFVYDEVDNLQLGFTVTVPVSISTTNTTNKIDSDNNVVNDKVEISTSPSLGLGLIWTVKPEKFSINAGTFIDLPEISFSNDTTKTKVLGTSSKESTTNWEGTSGNGTAIGLNTGFNWNLTPQLAFDCTYNLLGDILTSTMNSAWSNDLWDNINTILFHQLSLMLTLKL